MYAIVENSLVIGGTRSADQHGNEFWTGRRWSPASDEAKTFGSYEEAASHARENCDYRSWSVVEINDD